MVRTGVSRVAEELYYRLRGESIPPRICETCGIRFHEPVYSNNALRPEREGKGTITDGKATCFCCVDEQGRADVVKDLYKKQKRQGKQPYHPSGYISKLDNIKEPKDEYEAMWYGTAEMTAIHGIEPEEQWRQRQQGRYACYETGEFFDVENLEPVEVRDRRANQPSRWRRLSPGTIGWQEEYNKWIGKEELWPNPSLDYELGEITDELDRLEEIRPRNQE
jgi:hypothetical protein